jgi:antitoxin VapB
MGIKETIIVDIRKAFQRRRRAETPLQSAVRLRAKYGAVLSKRAQMPLPKDVFDEMWGDYSQSIAHAREQVDRAPLRRGQERPGQRHPAGQALVQRERQCDA